MKIGEKPAKVDFRRPWTAAQKQWEKFLGGGFFKFNDQEAITSTKKKTSPRKSLGHRTETSCTIKREHSNRGFKAMHCFRKHFALHSERPRNRKAKDRDHQRRKECQKIQVQNQSGLTNFDSGQQGWLEITTTIDVFKRIKKRPPKEFPPVSSKITEPFGIVFAS